MDSVEPVQGSQVFVELVIGPDRCLFHTTEHSDVIQRVNALKKGDLVSITADHTRSITGVDVLSRQDDGEWSPLSDGMRWRRNLGGPSRMHRLKQRQLITRAVRENLYSKEFLEVETPLLVKGACPDIHIDSLCAGKVGEEFFPEGYLVTSTEYQIKRMIVGGFEKVFTLTRNFRASDQGQYHSAEFTMLEWARAYGSMLDIEQDAIEFIRRAFQVLYPDRTSLNYLGKEIDILYNSWERISLREAFLTYLSLDPGDFSLEELSEAARKSRISIPRNMSDDRHSVLSFLLDRLQPHLGNQTPTFLTEWPAFMTSSAQVNEQAVTHAQIAERTELYIGGIEISDGFSFLRDATMQKHFFARELERRKNESKPIVAIDEKYIQALAEGIPPGAGMALGMDRLVMVLTGASQISDVQAFAWDEL